MIVRSKTKVRLLILLAGVFFIVGSGTSIFFVRKHRSDKYFAGLRNTGVAQYKNGDYTSALDNLAKCIRRQEYASDVEAIYAFAESRLRVEMPNDRHLAQGMAFLQRVLSIDSNRLDVQRELLDLYSQLGYHIEACTLADKILLLDKNDLQALRAKARALAARQQADKAEPICRQYNDLVPLDLEMRVLYLEILRELNRKTEIVDRALEIFSKNPTDPRAELILSIACGFTEELAPAQRQSLVKLIKDRYPDELVVKDKTVEDKFTPVDFARFLAFNAARRELTDLVLVHHLIDQLNATRQVEVSLAVLRKVDTQQETPWVRQMLVHRLWESGRFADLLKRTEKMTITGKAAGDVELLAMRGISQARTEAKEPAARTAKVLASLKDPAAQAWSTVIEELFLKSEGKPRRAIDAIEAALALQRNNAYLRYFLGMAYLQLGENDSAMDTFSQVIAKQPQWQLPLLHRSRLFLEVGQKQSALEDANEAWNINRLAPAARSNLAIVLADTSDLASIDTKSLLYILTADLQKSHPVDEATLPLWVQLLVHTGQLDEAKKVFNTALTSENPPGATTFLRLAAVSRSAKLGLEDDALAAAEKSAGLTSEIAYARATALIESAKPVNAAEYFQDAMQKAGASDVSWRLAWATLLEQIKDEHAAAAWIALADDPSLKGNLTVQQQALAARSTQSDAPFITRTISRIRAIAGDPAIGWKLAQARLQLREPVIGRNDPLIKSLTDIVASAPNNIDARTLLASAHEKSGNLAAAVEQISAARKLQPAAKVLSLQLARLYVLQLDFQRAREVLESLTANSLDPAQARDAARLLAQQGDIKKAINFMETAQAGATPLDQLDLAALYRRDNQPTRAEAIYKTLLQKPDRIEVIMAAADYYASSGRTPMAMQILENLEKLPLKPAEKEFALASYFSHHKPDEALAQYLAVVQSDPRKLNGWRALITEYIRLGKPDEAVENARKAIAALPADPVSRKIFQNVIDSAAMLKALAPKKEWFPLIAALLEPSPEGEAVAAALPIIVKAVEANDTAASLARKLRPIADGAPRLAPLQILVVQNYLVPDINEDADKNAEEAATLALRALSVSPASAEIAHNAALAVFRTRRWAQAMIPAQQWRDLSAQDPYPADVLIAEIQLNLEDYPAVLRDLAPYVEQAKANPKRFAAVFAHRAQALLGRGDEAGAFNILSPLLSGEPQMRAIFRDLSKILPNPLFEKWLLHLAAVTPPGDVNENIDLAVAWNALYSGRSAKLKGSNDPRHKEAAVAILDRLATTAPDDPFVIQARAILAQRENRTADAEEAYRRALQINPNLPIALNNLANMVSERGDQKEALSLAQRALAIRPNDASIQDTVGDVQLKLNDYPKAVENFKTAAKLDRFNIDRHIKLAQVYDQAGRNQDLAALLDEIEKMLSDPNVTDVQRDTIQKLRTKLSKTAQR